MVADEVVLLPRLFVAASRILPAADACSLSKVSMALVAPGIGKSTPPELVNHW